MKRTDSDKGLPTVKERPIASTIIENIVQSSSYPFEFFSKSLIVATNIHTYKMGGHRFFLLGAVLLRNTKFFISH